MSHLPIKKPEKEVDTLSSKQKVLRRDRRGSFTALLVLMEMYEVEDSSPTTVILGFYCWRCMEVSANNSTMMLLPLLRKV